MADDTPKPANAKSEPDQFVSDVRASVTSYFDATSDLRAHMHEDSQFNKGGEWQWTDADKERLRSEKRPILSFPVITSIINFVAGYQWEQDTDYRAFPRGSESEQIGRIVTLLLKYAMDTTSGRLVQHQQFRRGIISGLGVVEVVHSFENVDDLVEGECAINLIPELSWYYEVGARRYDRNDANFMGKMMWVTPHEGVTRWPKHREAFKKTGPHQEWFAKDDPRLTGVPEHMLREFYDEKTGRVRVLQHWYRVPVTVHILVNTQTGEAQPMESGEEAEKVIRRIYDTEGKKAASVYQIVPTTTATAVINTQNGAVHEFSTPDQAEQAVATVRKAAGRAAADMFEIVVRDTTALRVAHLTGWQLLDDKPSPYGADWRYPFVPFICYQDQDDFTAIKGLIRDVKDAQREVNWHHATMLDSLVRGPKSGVWVHKGEHIDIEKLRRNISRPGFVNEYVGQPPVPQAPAVISQADQELLQFGIEMIMRISSVTAEMLGQTTQKTVSGRAIGLRQQGGLVGISSLFANWLETRRLTGELLVRRIQQYYSPEKMTQIVGDNQSFAKQMGLWGVQIPPDEMVFQNFQTIRDAEMKIVVDYQESSPTARNAIAQQMLQFKAIGVPIPLDLIIEASDIPYKEEIKAALKAQGEQPPDLALIQAVGAAQGNGASNPNGVNTA